MTIPIDAVSTVSVQHLNPFKPLLAPVLGAFLGLGAFGSYGGGDGELFLPFILVGAGLGALYGAGHILFIDLPDQFTDRPTYYFHYARQNLPIVVVDSSAH